MSAIISSRASSASTGAPPIGIRKKRLACDNCHLSKVRCTGEISGCQRCERGNKTCHYSESNMGKSPADGANRRRKSNAQRSTVPSATNRVDDHQHQQQQQHHDWNTSSSHFEGANATEQQDEAAFTSTITRRDSDFQQYQNQPASDSMSIWDDPSDQQQQQSSATMLLDTIANGLQSPAFDPLLSNFDDIDFSDIDESQFEVVGDTLDINFPRLVGSPSPITTTPSQSSSQKPQMPQFFEIPSSTTSTSRGSMSSQASGMPPASGSQVNFWTIQLEELSRRPQKPPIPLDELLHQSSQLLPRVTGVVGSLGSADVSSSATQLILILLCLTQTIALFEQCIPSVISGRSTSGSPGDLSLHLGAFQVDREVQQALQLHVVGRELSTILRSCKMIKQTLSQPHWNSISRRTHALLLEDLQVRTKTLIYQMKQKAGSSRRLAL